MQLTDDEDTDEADESGSSPGSAGSLPASPASNDHRHKSGVAERPPLKRKYRSTRPSALWPFGFNNAFNNGRYAQQAPLGKAFLFFGVILPVVAIVFESTTHFCAKHFFDPFPSANHIVLFLLIPLSNFLAYYSRRKNLSAHYAFMSLSSGMAMGIALMYALMFLPLTGPAMFSMVYLGFGLLGLAPLLALPCLWASGKAVCHLASDKKTYFDAHQVKHMGHIIVLVMFLAVELPSTLTRMNLSLASEPKTALQGITWLREFGNQEVLLRACYERSGRATDIVGSLYEAHHPLSIEDARQIFYKVTGKPFNSVPIPSSARATIQRAIPVNDPANLNAAVEDEFDIDADVAGEQVSGVVRGLAAADSALSIKMEPDAMIASIDWSFTFENSSKYDREARGKILLPPGAVVTRAVLTVNNVEHDATIMVREAARAYYRAAVIAHKEDPLLLSTCGPDQVLLQCFPVHPGSQMKVKLTVVSPLAMDEKQDVALELPTFIERNFQVGDSTKISVESNTEVSLPNSKTVLKEIPSEESKTSEPSNVPALPGSAADLRSPAHVPDSEKSRGSKNAFRWKLDGTVTASQLSSFSSIIHSARDKNCKTVLCHDTFVNPPKIVEREIVETHYPLPANLAVLIDGSASMKGHMPEIVEGLRALPSSVTAKIVVIGDQEKLLCFDAKRNSSEFESALRILEKYEPAGGQDDSAALVNLVTRARDTTDSAVLWIHSAQPIPTNSNELLKSLLSSRAGKPLLYDLQLLAGPVEVLGGVNNCAGIQRLPRTGSATDDIRLLFRAFSAKSETDGFPSGVAKDLRPGGKRASSALAQLAGYRRILRNLDSPNSVPVGETDNLCRIYHLVTPISSAVVVDPIPELDRISLPVPVAAAAPDPVLQSKLAMDEWFDVIDASFAFVKYQIDKTTHPRDIVAQLNPLEHLKHHWNSAISESFGTITNQLNKLNAVTNSARDANVYSSTSPEGSASVVEEGSADGIAGGVGGTGSGGDAFDSTSATSTQSIPSYPSPRYSYAPMRKMKASSAGSSSSPNLPVLQRSSQDLAPGYDKFEKTRQKYSKFDRSNAATSGPQSSESDSILQERVVQGFGTAGGALPATDVPAQAPASSAPAQPRLSPSFLKTNSDQMHELKNAKQLQIVDRRFAGQRAQIDAVPMDAKKKVSEIEFLTAAKHPAEKPQAAGELPGEIQNKDSLGFAGKETHAISVDEESEQVTDKRMRSDDAINETKKIESEDVPQSAVFGRLGEKSPSSQPTTIYGVNTAGTAKGGFYDDCSNTSMERASKVVTYLSLLLSAALAAIVFSRSSPATKFRYVSALSILILAPFVFYVLGSFFEREIISLLHL